MITVSEQLAYFKEYTERLKMAKGEAAAKEIIGEALYIWSIGTNDFIENYYNLPSRRMEYTVGEYQAYLVGLAEAAIRRVHALGGRKMDFTGLTPMGCLPAERVGNRGTCNQEYNAVARSFNARIKELIAKLNKDLPGLQLVFADTYDLLASVVDKPAAYGACVHSFASQDKTFMPSGLMLLLICSVETGMGATCHVSAAAAFSTALSYNRHAFLFFSFLFL